MKSAVALPAIRGLAIALLLLLGNTEAPAQAVGSTFTYQGELRSAGAPATGGFDMEFRLYDAEAGGAQIGPAVIRPAVAVAQGLFSVQLDFGPSQFAGDRQWLEVRVRASGGSFETLSPRTELTAAPYALGAVVALANSVTGTSIVDGSIGSADIDPSQVQRRVSGACPAGQFLRAVNADGSVACGADADSGGTVTSIATGAGLTGGPISASGTISIAPGGVGSAQIDSAQVQRRVSGNCPAGSAVRLVNADGSVACSVIPAAWALGGNENTNPELDYLGTNDAAAFEIRAGKARGLRIEPSSVLVNELPITSNTLGGSRANEVAAGVRGATIGGGGTPLDGDPVLVGARAQLVSDHYGTVGGGLGNRAGSDDGNPGNATLATVGGGFRNIAGGGTSTVSGGSFNTADGGAATIAGGQNNTASGELSSIGGGGLNATTATYSAVVGGQSNGASARWSTVSGGLENCAGGEISWVGGNRAKVRRALGAPAASLGCSGVASVGSTGDQGTFVWADSQSSDFVSTGSNQFLIRAQGGAAINSNDPAGNGLRVNGTLRVDTLGTAAATTLCRNASNQIAGCSSSARYKTDIEDLGLGLETALQLRAVAYAWKDGGDADVGFVAEEVAAIDPRLVTRNAAGEIEGVKYERLTAVLAGGLQELAAREALAAESQQALEAENAGLRRQLAAVEARLQRLEQLLLANEPRAH